MKPVVFLDFDGVVSVPTYYKHNGVIAEVRMEEFKPSLMRNVRKFVESNDMQIVLSTDHRNTPWDELASILDFNIPMRLLHPDYKTRVKGPRHVEVQDWLDRNGNPEYLIVDDWALMFEGASDHMLRRFVQCTYDRGFDDHKMAEAQERWNEILHENTNNQTPAQDAALKA